MPAGNTLGPLPERPLVSVVIPCYNQGRFLAEAIESALGQTYPLTETVVVDDGSTDDTPVVTRAHPRARYFYQENGGLAAARNRGFQESKGECLVFLDSDDRLHPHAVEVGLRQILGGPDTAFAYGRCNLVDVDGALLGTSDRPAVEGDHYGPLLHGNFLPNPGAMMFRREALRKRA